MSQTDLNSEREVGCGRHVSSSAGEKEMQRNGGRKDKVGRGGADKFLTCRRLEFCTLAPLFDEIC